jgi:hypothetical protein
MYAVAQVITNKPADEATLMLAADFDAMALSLGQPIPLPGCMPAWAESDAEAQKLFVQIKREFPELGDECAWCLIGQSLEK